MMVGAEGPKRTGSLLGRVKGTLSSFHRGANRTDARVALSPADIQQALGPGRYFRVDNHPQALATGRNLGKPAVLSQPRSQFTREILNIAHHLSSGNGAS